MFGSLLNAESRLADTRNRIYSVCMLTAHDIELVQKSWMDISVDQNTAIRVFYDRLFETHPELEVMFHDDMEAQRRKFLGVFDFVIKGLSDLDGIRDDIAAAGIRHLEYGAVPAHYPVVGETLLWTLEDMLGMRYTEEVASAWRAVYEEIATIMLEASKKAA